jgi:saccharopine dehydrogenase-like NADP-dependent oxidoreductase
MSLHDTAQPAKRIIIVGGGRAGEAILTLLATDARYEAFVCEIDYDRLRALREAGHEGAQISGADARQMEPLLADAACVICAAPPSVAGPLARAAFAVGCAYVDMSEETEAISALEDEVQAAGLCFAPGCGLAPGYVATLVDAMIRDAGAQADITAYVGVLPASRENRLGYGNLWGIDGLMAEYTNPGHALVNGEIVSTAPLKALEEITIGAEQFEAFTTSGSLEELARHYQGHVRGLAFKTLRYPGHLDYVRFLLDDLKLSERLYMFRNLLLNGLPMIERDRIIIHVIDRNPQAPRQITRLFGTAHTEHEPAPASDDENGAGSTVAHVAAQHVCAVTDIIVQGLAPRHGVLHHNDLTMELLGQSRFADALDLTG